MTQVRLLSAAAAILLGLGAIALPRPSAAQAPDPSESAPPASAQEYVVKADDTLASIAVELTGDEANWELIARANGIAHAGKLQQLEAGTRLRIPAALRS